jgi:hypothetical protein
MYLLIAFSVLGLAFLLLAIRGRSTHVRNPRAAGEMLAAVDIDSFRNLVDEQQDDFLRQRLSRGDYRRVQRARALATTEYLRKIARNASIMLRAGESARHCDDPAVSALGPEMVSSAINLRLNCLLALALAYAGVLFPGIRMSLTTIVERYDRLVTRLHAAGRYWAPAPGEAR